MVGSAKAVTQKKVPLLFTQITSARDRFFDLSVSKRVQGCSTHAWVETAGNAFDKLHG